MPHDLSFECYLKARSDPTIPLKRYEDLEALIHLFGLGDVDQAAEKDVVLPGRFTLQSYAPTILIVEDETEVADLAKTVLVEWDYPSAAIHIFNSGEEALFFAEKHAVGIALLDLRLANPFSVRNVYLSGLRVLRGIKETSPGAKVVIVSGYGTYKMVYKAILELGASYYLSKPVTMVDILRIIHWAVERILGPDIVRAISTTRTISPDTTNHIEPISSTGEQLENILVVDDDLAIAESISLALRFLGYQTMAAEGGEEALGKLEKYQFDAVLLDIRMPDIDGLEVLRRIVQRDRNTVVVMLTAVGNEEIAEEAMRLGADNFLTKPCNIDTVQITLEYAFAQRYRPSGA